MASKNDFWIVSAAFNGEGTVCKYLLTYIIKRLCTFPKLANYVSYFTQSLLLCMFKIPQLFTHCKKEMTVNLKDTINQKMHGLDSWKMNTPFLTSLCKA